MLRQRCLNRMCVNADTFQQQYATPCRSFPTIEIKQSFITIDTNVLLVFGMTLQKNNTNYRQMSTVPDQIYCFPEFIKKL